MDFQNEIIAMQLQYKVKIQILSYPKTEKQFKLMICIKLSLLRTELRAVSTNLNRINIQDTKNGHEHESYKETQSGPKYQPVK